MRIVDPGQFKNTKPKRNKHKRNPVYVVGAIFVIVTCLLGIYSQRNQSTETKNTGQNVMVKESSDNKNAGSVDTSTKTKLRLFTDNEFRIFYDNLLQTNLERVENSPVISGDDIADARIRKLAEDRGYRLRNSPSGTLVTIEGNLLQPAVQKPWEKLKKAAAAKGLRLSIVSGYRSVEDQRSLFLQRLGTAGATIAAVAAGKADSIVNKVLITTSIPGYSKHHTGYTLDFACAGFVFENFKNSTCNDWLKAENYKHAKEYGFIPSYPPKADVQGPDPEAWEYVWVGTDLLYQ